MNKFERLISIIMLVVISLSNVATPAAYAAELAIPTTAIPGTDLHKPQFAAKPKFAVDTGSVLGASTSLLTVGSQSLDLTDGNSGSANKRIPVQVQKLEKKVYRSDEDVTLAVTNPDNEAFVTSVQNSTGDPVSVPITETNNGSTTTVDLASSDTIKPGKYTVVVTDQNGKNTAQDFTWGVLALNTDKSLYHPNETADISMAVLNDQGDMVCDAKVELRIKNSELGIDDTLSTDASASAKQIVVNPQCDKHDYSLQPDYESHYKFGGTGSYQFTLTANTPNGTHTISDSIQVQNVIPFDVQRVSATRIYPPNSYPMTFNITANRDFTGTVTETVPDSFTIMPATDSATTVSSYTTMSTVYLNSNDPAMQMEQAIAASASGGLVMPFQGKFPITQGFGAQLTDPTLQAFYTHYGLAGHDGIDFGVPMNTPLYAVDGGTVIWSGPGDYGTMVTIQHSWGETYYGHMSNPVVSVGQTVIKGQLIGYSGMSGEATGPHLHFGMKPLKPDITNGYYGKVDPMPYLPIGQGQSIAALGPATNPIASAMNNIAVLGASDSAATPTPSNVPSTVPTVSPTIVPSILPTSAPASTNASGPSTSSGSAITQSAVPSVIPTPTTQTEKITTIGKSNTAPDNTNFSVLQKQIMLDEEIANNALTEKVKMISWHVSLKKGQSTSVGYDFQGPHVSPQFYLLGPMHFYDSHGKDVFQEQRHWQIASDDVGIEWYQNNSGSSFNGYSWPYRKKVTIDHTKVNGVTPVTVDSVHGGSIVTWNHTVSGSNPALLVGVAVGGEPATVASGMSATATYNGTSMSLLDSELTGDGDGVLFVFGLTSAPTGTHQVKVNVTGGGWGMVTGGSQSFDNVTSFGTPSVNSNDGTTANTTAITTTSGNILAGFVAAGSGLNDVQAPATSNFIANETNSNGAGNCAGATTPATGGSDSMTWDISASDQWAAIGVEVQGTSVAYDTTCGTSGCPSSAGYTPVTTASDWDHTVSGTNPALLVEVSVGGADTGITASVTYNGTSMSSLSTVHSGGGTNGFIEVFGLTSAATGNHEIDVTISGGTPQELTTGSISFDNVGSFGSPITNTGTTGATMSTNAVSTTAGNLLAGFVVDGSQILSATAPSTSEFINNWDDNTQGGNSAGAVTNSTGGSVTMKWSDNLSDDWGTIALEVQTATNNSSISNFPALVNLSSDSDLAAKAQSSGADILFTDSTGRTLLPFELENYNSSTGSVQAWVNISSLSSTSDTVIYMYYGNPSTASKANATGVWDSDYKGVYHLGPTTPGGATLSVNDSTGNSNGTNSGTPSTYTSSGEIDGGASLGGSSYINTNLDATVNNLYADVSVKWSVEAWFNTSTSTGTMMILGRGGGTGASATFGVWLAAGTLKSVLAGTTTATIGTAGAYDDGNWHSLVITWDGSTAMAYVDGIGTGLSVGNAALQTGDKMCIGGTATCTTDPYTGSVDEVRASDIPRSVGWFQTEYNNEHSPSTFYSLGGVETDLYAPQLSAVLGHGEWFDSTGTRQPFVF